MWSNTHLVLLLLRQLESELPAVSTWVTCPCTRSHMTALQETCMIQVSSLPEGVLAICLLYLTQVITFVLPAHLH